MPRPRSHGRQLALFDVAAEPAAPRREKREIGPAAVPDDLRSVAERLPPNIRFGTSSWSFPGWEGLVYDADASTQQLARNGLAAYAGHPLLRAVGIDRTFYGPVESSALARYAEQVPEGFRFLVKAASQCTSPYTRDAQGRPDGENPDFLDVGFATELVVRPFVEGLDAKGGVLLFQFPPLGARICRSASAFAQKLAGFLDSLPEGPSYAVELRDAALLCTDYFCSLEQVGARHCISVHPRMPAVDEQVALAGPALAGPLVVRWMLHTGLGYEAARERYAPFDDLVDEDVPTRQALAGLCREQLALGHDVIVVANNKAEGSAPRTVFELARAIAEQLDS